MMFQLVALLCKLFIKALSKNEHNGQYRWQAGLVKIVSFKRRNYYKNVRYLN